MKKELLFKSFETLQVKAHVKSRLFAVLIISFFFQIHLFGAAIKITPKEGRVGLINMMGSAEDFSDPADLVKTIVYDSTRQSANTFAIKARTQLQENPTKIIPSDKVSQESPNHLEEKDKTIFVTGGTTVIGLDKIYKVKIVLETRKPEPTEFSKTSFSEQTIKTLSEKKADKKLARLVKKIQEKTKYHFSVSSGGESGITGRLHKTKKAVVFTSNVVQKHALASTYNQVILKIESQLQKQKFYSSLSYLQFGKFRSSSLRGPPYAA
ncbi:hypothetical protein [Chryseobacterium sp.]|uniref:hypothetical protein n=1 Tax=Chryseobacterium sp. TaxID=1871047 RepID=UPI002FCA54B8